MQCQCAVEFTTHNYTEGREEGRQQKSTKDTPDSFKERLNRSNAVSLYLLRTKSQRSVSAWRRISAQHFVCWAMPLFVLPDCLLVCRQRTPQSVCPNREPTILAPSPTSMDDGANAAAEEIRVTAIRESFMLDVLDAKYIFDEKRNLSATPVCCLLLL